eukprot:TRINITY_DN7909_c0_g1_i1.p1 TRINITY_DN7909_c0_g1~~TRINITY_DN7909_c0_g1_i1.p1  ORF type:complete len:293 (+),score=66.58 TRINITY_DN7909_c0_g1_i1:38-880(+)
MGTADGVLADAEVDTLSQLLGIDPSQLGMIDLGEANTQYAGHVPPGETQQQQQETPHQPAAAVAGDAAASSSSGPTAAATATAAVIEDIPEGFDLRGLTPVIENCVCQCHLGTNLDLREIAIRARNMEYNPQSFSACVMRMREPRATALIFSTGKMILTGCKSEEEAKLAAKKCARLIQKLGFNVRFLQYRVQNVVALIDVRFPIRLEQLHRRYLTESTYEPEVFPSLTYRLTEPKLTAMIFCSGKVVFTGARSVADIRLAIPKICKMLDCMRVQVPADV